jgi:hypothetical protein
VIPLATKALKLLEEEDKEEGEMEEKWKSRLISSGIQIIRILCEILKRSLRRMEIW